LIPLQEKVVKTVFLIGCIAFCSVGYAQSKNDFQKIDSLLSIGDHTKKPGGVVAVLKGDEVVYKKAVGLADISRNIPNSFDHKYDLASIAKQFTGMCIALLEEQGKLSTEDLLSLYYPDFQFSKEIKIKNLLDHTSGIREAYVLATLSGKINLKGELRKKYNTKPYLMKVLRREKDLNFEPGSELAYTNINYILLGDIVEKVSKQPLYRFADSAIFKPLQMNNTFYRFKQNMEIPGEAKGYFVKGKKYKPVKAVGGILGDGKLVTTIDDLLKWENNLRHNKLGKSSQQLIDKLYTSSKLNNGDLTHYGYGFWINEYRGLKQINHGGDDGRFTSFILKFPEQDIVVIALANSSLYNNTVSTSYQIADILLSGDFPKPKTIQRQYQFTSISKQRMRSLVGIYKTINDKGLAQLRRITSEGDSLYINSDFNGKGLNLKAVTNNFFVAKNRNGYQLKFTFNNDSIDSSFEEQFSDNKPWKFEKIENTARPLTDFKGTYFNESTQVSLAIKSKKNKLIARKGIIKIPLVAFGGNQFYAYQNDALFIFQQDNFGKINSLKVNASDFRNFIFTKLK
jgi:CubicO group peptidase (beta-lactamase class C family)